MKLVPILARVRMKLAPIFHIKISFETSKLTDCLFRQAQNIFETSKLMNRLFRQAQNIFVHKHKRSDGRISPFSQVDSVLGRTDPQAQPNYYGAPPPFNSDSRQIHPMSQADQSNRFLPSVGIDFEHASGSQAITL